MKKIFNLLPWRWSKTSNGQGGTPRSDAMRDIVSKDLRQALNDPKTRYRIVDAVISRTKEEVPDRMIKPKAAAASTENGKKASGKQPK